MRVVSDIAASGVVIRQPHHAVLADHEGNALDLLVLVHAHPEVPPEFKPLVGQQLKWNVKLGGELGLRRLRIRANAEDLGAGLGELLVELAEGGRLLGSTAGMRLRVIEQHHGLFSTEIRTAYLTAVMRAQRKLRRAVACFDHLHRTQSPFRLCESFASSHHMAICTTVTLCFA